MDPEEIEFEKAFTQAPAEQPEEAKDEPKKACPLRSPSVVYEGGCEACE